MTEQRRYRYRITFAKMPGMRFTSTLDLHRAWERTLRRAGVPLVYTQGYNPKPRINLGSALPLGYTSNSELVDIWLEQETQPDELLEDLRRVAPPGLNIMALERVEAREASLQSQITAADYHVEIDVPTPLEDLHSSIKTLLAKETLPRKRRGKDYDLRPLIESLEIDQENARGIVISMRLAAREGATGRPDEVLLALGLDPTCARINRTRLVLAKQVTSDP
jgi:radical SAM-linked protein